MNVETFEVLSVDEIGGQIIVEERDPQSLALIEKLGLTGQQSLLVRDETGAPVASNPYRVMELAERRILSYVCPTQTRLENYSSGPIPLRVLQVAAHATEMFSRLEVWHPATARDDNPVLVGVQVNPERTWDETLYLLARWGKTLVSWDELRAAAQRVLVSQARAELTKSRGEIDAALGALDALADTYLHGEYVAWPCHSAPYARGA